MTEVSLFFWDSNGVVYLQYTQDFEKTDMKE